MSVTTGVGLVSGIDFESYIQQIAQVSRSALRPYQIQQANKQSQADALSGISTQLTALRDQIEKMLEPEHFMFTDATSSNDSVLEVTAEDTAANGSYTVRVLQMATAERLGSQGFSSLSDGIASGDGKFKIQMGVGAVRSYDVDADTTLTQLRDMINQDTQSGVTASIVNDGSATNPYRLVLSAKSTGSANSVSIVQNDTSLDFTNKTIEDAVAKSTNQFDGTASASGTYTGEGSMRVVARITQAGAVDGAARFEVSLDGGVTFSGDYAATSAAQDISSGLGVELGFGAGTQDFAVGDTFSIDVFDPSIGEAKDAIISVDGVTVSRSTNTFEGVIDGVTFTARSVSDEAVTATVQYQKGLLNAEVMNFQNAYNNVLNTLDQVASYDPNSEMAGPLFGDATVRSIRSMLAGAIGNPVSGIDSQYTTLASIGLTTLEGGRMGFNQTTMNEALNNAENIMKLFGRIGDSTSSQVRLYDTDADTPAGTYSVDVTQAAKRATVDANQAIRSLGLENHENLTFTFNDNTFTVNLTAGDTIESVVSKINDKFDDEGVNMVASQDGGALKLETTSYGSEAAFSVVSDADGSTNAQTGIGQILQEATGSDVVGTINGAEATGTGRVLSLGNGFQVQITSTGPIQADVTYTRGVADRMLDSLEQYLDSDTGIIEAKQDGLADAMERINARITSMEDRISNESDRLRRQFIAMEQQISQWNSIGDMLSRSLSQLQSSSST